MASTIEIRSGVEFKAASGNRLPPWRFPSQGIAVRLFLTCWLIYCLHFATNTVREIYLALAIGDHLSFRVDEYAGMHPDLFEKEGYGWHIGANPGASMIAAIPYAVSRPLLDRIVSRVNAGRVQKEPPVYNSPWPMAREFYSKAWMRGYDVKFGLGALVMQTLCMAPISAAAAVAMFFLFRRLFRSDAAALWLAVLYAFGTPVFFRTGYLNHNLILGHFAFFGFLAMWNPGASPRWTVSTRYFLGGLAGGTALLFDYSGVVILLGMLAYGLVKAFQKTRSIAHMVKQGSWYVVGSLGPVVLLWFYQWSSFGHPFYPGQHWMPPVQWIETGYQGFTGPQAELLKALLFDYRFGLFAVCPLFVLALAAPFLSRGEGRVVPVLELAALLGIPVALWLFCGGISYTRLQFNTGIRYLAPLFPFLFVAAALTLMHLPRRAIYFVGIVSIMQAWCMAMYREVERGFGVLEPVLHVFGEGFQLPVLTVLSRMGSQYGTYFENHVSPLPAFLFLAALLYGIWAPGLNASQASPKGSGTYSN